MLSTVYQPTGLSPASLFFTNAQRISYTSHHRSAPRLSRCRIHTRNHKRGQVQHIF
ncbi:hypothetical protein RSAG8_10157, partial [Rhizoctonia solani AG-8 WAC10335]